MRVLAINGSPNEAGGTYTALRVVTQELENAGIETEILHIGKEPVRGCIGCGGCRKGTPRCVFGGDAVNEALDKIESSQGIILGTPVFYSAIAGSMKCFMDRFFYAGTPLMTHKIGAAVASVRRAGAIPAINQMLNYYSLCNVIVAPSAYWPGIFGNAEQSVQDEEGRHVLRDIGRSMAWLMQVTDSTKDTIPPPQPQKRPLTSFIR